MPTKSVEDVRLEPAGPRRYLVHAPRVGLSDLFLGLVHRERYQSRRTYATGWRWFYNCWCHGTAEKRAEVQPRDRIAELLGEKRVNVGLEGYQTRQKAVEALVAHDAGRAEDLHE